MAVIHTFCMLRPYKENRVKATMNALQINNVKKKQKIPQEKTIDLKKVS